MKINEGKSDVPLKRTKQEYKDLSERFVKCPVDFSKQYAHIYAARFNAMHGNLLKKIDLKWGAKYPVKRLCELKEEKEEKCVVIGTLFKHQQLKPSILKELSDELRVVPQPQRSNFADDTDYLILEDELQRIRLDGDLIDPSKIVTGIVCAILGYENSDGRFTVLDYCWLECLPQKSLSTIQDDCYVVIASGLNFSSVKDNSLPIQLLSDWICGNVGSLKERKDVASVCRMIIAGNSVSGTPKDSTNGAIINTIISNVTNSGYDMSNSLGKLDETLNRLCQSIPVDIMPGEFDPTNLMLPQKPMHFCMFPKAFAMNSFNGVPNPYECQIGGRIVCGSSGQPIKDILRYTKITSHLEALRLTLRWGHIAPTAPDTLACNPCYGVDPFVLENCPDIYFSGNCDSFETELFKGENDQKIRLICVPSFAETRTIALVNLKNLDCVPVTFLCDSFDPSDIN